MKKFLVILWLIIILAGMSYIVWFNEWQSKQPPAPEPIDIKSF